MATDPTSLVGLSEEEAGDILGGPRSPGAWLWQEADGRVLEAQIGLDGGVASAARIAPDQVEAHREVARHYVLPEERREELGRALAQRGNGEDLLDHVFGAARDGLVHLGTRLSPDGAQSRAYAIRGEAGFRLDLHADGSWDHLVPEQGFLGFLRLQQAYGNDPAVPERHATIPGARSWGEAFAHARSTGAAVVGVREHYDANPRVALYCDEPEERTAAWYPRFDGDGPLPDVPVRRVTRTYRIRDRRVPDVAWMGDPSHPSLLGAEQWSLLATTLTHPGRATPPSVHDRRVAEAALAEILRMIPATAETVPDDAFRTTVGRKLRDRAPDRFTRAGLERARAALRAD